MRNHFLKYILIGFIVFAGANETISQKKIGQIQIGDKYSLKSNFTGEDQEYWVALPYDYNNKKNYPVIYLLDGDAHLKSVSGIVYDQSTVNGNNKIPEMIVVGILNNNRTRDLVPFKGDTTNPMVLKSFLVEPGAEEFQNFLEKELIPKIESEYSTADYRMLVGHSFGGLTALHILRHKPKMFKSYIAIDPSVWWGNADLLKEYSIGFDKLNLEGISLYMSMANTYPENPNLIKVKNDTSDFSFHIRSLIKMDSILSARKDFNYRGKFYENDTHCSVHLISVYEGLRFCFDFYPFEISMTEYFIPNEGLIDRIRKHYQIASDKLGYSLLPNEDWVNMLGYQFIEFGFPEISAKLFEMNIQNFPNSANAYDSYADYFLLKGDKQEAIIQLKKAIELDGDKFYKDRLKRLKEQ